MRTLLRPELAVRRAWRPHLLAKFTQYAVRDTPASYEQRAHYWSTQFLRYDYANTGTVREFEPTVLSAGVLAGGMEHVQGPFGVGGLQQELLLRLRNGPVDDFAVATGSPTGQRLKDYLEDQWPLMFGELELGEIRLDIDAGERPPDLTSLVGDEHDVWFRGEVVEVQQETEAVLALRFRQTLFGRATRTLLGPVVADPQAQRHEVGRRYPTRFGQDTAAPLPIPAVGYDAIGATTVAVPMTIFTNQLTVTDAADLRGYGVGQRLIIGNEHMDVVSSSGNLATVSRGVNGQLEIVAHGAGEAVIDVGASAGEDSRWMVSDEAIPAGGVGEIFVQIPATGELVATNSSYWQVSEAQAGPGPDAVPGPYCRVQIDRTNLISLLGDLVAFRVAQLQEQQISVAVNTSVNQGLPDLTITEQRATSNTGPTQGQSVGVLRDNDTSVNFISPSLSAFYQGSVFFPAPSGAIVSQEMVVWFQDQTSGSGSAQYLKLFIGNTLIYSSQISPGAGPFVPAGTTLGPVGNGSNTMTFQMQGSTPLIKLYEIKRNVTYAQDDLDATSSASVTVDVKSATASAIGSAMKIFVAADGLKAPDGNYIEASGNELRHTPDILRFLIAQRMGQGHAALDAASWAQAEADLAGQLMYGELGELGLSDEDILARLCWEGRCQLSIAQRATAQTYRLHTASHRTGGQYLFPTPTRTLEEAQAWVVSQRPVESVRNEGTMLADFDRTFSPGDTEGFKVATPVDVEHPFDATLFPAVNTLPSTSDEFVRDRVARSRREAGPRGADGTYAFVAQRAAEAEKAFGFLLNEQMNTRSRRVFAKGLPWRDALDLELGDLVWMRVPHLPATQRIEPWTDPGTTDHLVFISGGSGWAYTNANTGAEQGGTSLRATAIAAATATSARFPLVVDLGAAAEFVQLDVRVDAAMLALLTSISLVLTSDATFATDFEIATWAVGLFTADTWVTVTMPVTDFLIGPGSWEKGKTTLAQLIVTTAPLAGGETVQFSNLRRGPLVKGRVVGFAKALGGTAERGRIDLTVVEVP